jgi:hypothetical protein
MMIFPYASFWRNPKHSFKIKATTFFNEEVEFVDDEAGRLD